MALTPPPSSSAWVVVFLQMAFVVLLAPLLHGWIGFVRAVLQNRKPAGLLQPWRNLVRLLRKETILPEGHSYLFLLIPPLFFSVMAGASLLIPFLMASPPLSPMADAVTLVGLFSLARFAMAAAAMDLGTPFGDMGGRREMMVAFLTEPATLMILFTVSLWSGSTAIPSVLQSFSLGHSPFHPSLLIAAMAFILVFLGENARLPIDNPSTHLELTMIHEAMLLEYSGPLLALMEWGSMQKLLLYLLLGIDFFAPSGISRDLSATSLLVGPAMLLGKLIVLGAGIALIESIFAKLRIFRVPEFTALAYLLSTLGFLLHFLLEV